MKISDWVKTSSGTEILVFTSEEFTFTLDFGTGSVWGSASPDYECASGNILLGFYGRGGTLTGNNISGAEKGSATFRKELARQGWLTVYPDCGADSWGSLKGYQITLDSLAALSSNGIRIPEKFPVIGFSMGGLAALLFAVRSPEKTARLVDVFGVTDLYEKYSTTHPESIRKSYHSLDEIKKASVFLYLDRFSKIPVAIFHGRKDEVVPLAGSERLYAGLKKFGGCSFTVNESFGHTNDILEDIGQGILCFISTELKSSCNSVEYKS